MKKIRIVAAAIVLFYGLAFGLPIIVARSSSRTVASRYNLIPWPRRVYDTDLPIEELTPLHFEDAIRYHERYGTNSIAQLAGLILERRLRVTELSGSETHPQYNIRVYTYFNLPLYTTRAGYAGGETVFTSRDPENPPQPSRHWREF